MPNVLEGLFQVVADGLASGTIYAAVALSLALIYRTTGVVNFAQGEIGMIGTFIAWALLQRGIPLIASVALALALAFLLGAAMERFVIRPIQRFGELSALLTTLGMFLMLNEIAPWIWGPENRAFPSLFGAGVVDLGSVRISASSLGTLALMLAVVAAFFALLHATKLGLSMRAAAANPESSGLCGIPTQRVFMLGWGLSAMMSTLAGVLSAPRLFLDSSLMVGVIIYAFAAAALGGFTSLGGAVLGGLLIGLSETLASNYLPFIGSDLKMLVPLVVLLLVLLIKPNGLFGQAAGRSV